MAASVVRELWLDHLILGVDGISADMGASCFHEGEASINALMVKRATEVTVVAGAEKLGRRTFARICDITAIKTVVTDASAADDDLESLRSKGLHVIVV